MKQSTVTRRSVDARYDTVFHRVVGIVVAANLSAARSVNAYMTEAYWMVGRRIVEFDPSGEPRAGYRANPIERLTTDGTRWFGRGLSSQNPWQLRRFGLANPPDGILQSLSGELAKRLPGSSDTLSLPLLVKKDDTAAECALATGAPNK